MSLAICSVERSEVADNAYNIVPLDSEEPPFNGRMGIEANGWRMARQPNDGTGSSVAPLSEVVVAGRRPTPTQAARSPSGLRSTDGEDNRCRSVSFVAAAAALLAAFISTVEAGLASERPSRFL